ncbi:MAG TPA: carboxypeptidase-like regulatory domain-containing protein [Vicinamibacterales bacterium]|nr:carboxypeptidase-like regulatory domain-containing protein [Vicinamibacterales bacterium]
MKTHWLRASDFGLPAWSLKPGACWLLLTGLSLFMPGSAAAQVGIPGAPGSGVTVSIRTATDNRPIPGATVTFRDSSGRVIATATTPADGIVRFANIAAGQFAVEIAAAGFANASTTIAVAAGQVAATDVVLTRTTESPVIQNPVPRPPGISTPAGEVAVPDPLPPDIPRPASTGEDGQPVLAPDARVFVPMPDRWNISMPDWDRYGEHGDYPYVSGRWWDPYNRNRFKGDYPILGQRTFFVFTGVSDSLLEGRHVPVPAVPASARPLSEKFFGRGGVYLPVSIVRTSFDLFRGDTAFRPVDWRVRVQPAVSFNYLHTQETAIVNADVRKGTTRFDAHVGLQEAFFEAKLADLSSNYDVLSVRAGIQELSTDFRGFVAVVEQPGLRLFGTLRSSRIEYNAAFFDFLEKEANSGFNELHRRHQQMAVANVYVQDFLTRGYTTQFSYHYNRDTGEPHYDTNGFLVRPAPIGVIRSHEVRSSYFGWAGNGHIGRLNLTHAFYQVTGTDELNPIEAREVDINARMAAVELSIDKDWLRIKGSVFYATGDDDVNDGKAEAFDSIVDIPVFAGGPFSLWNRQGLRLTQTNTGLVSPFSLLPDLRTNKDEGQQNFVNPGIVILQGGVDVEVTPKLRAFTTVSTLRFRSTAVLEALLFQAPIRNNIGVDFGGGAQYRPPLSENIVITAGASALRLGDGLRDVYDGRHYFVSLFANLRLQF